MKTTETTIYLLKFALEIIEQNELEDTKNKDNWTLGKDIEAHIKELEIIENNDTLPDVIGRMIERAKYLHKELGKEGATRQCLEDVSNSETNYEREYNRGMGNIINAL